MIAPAALHPPSLMQQHLPILRRHQALHKSLLCCTERNPLGEHLTGGDGGASDEGARDGGASDGGARDGGASDGGASDEGAQALAEAVGVVVHARIYEGEGDPVEGVENFGWGEVG
jgi:hypothetical protein